MDLLRYSDTVLQVCFKDMSRREIHDVLRKISVYPTRVRICPCATDPWVRQTLTFLGAAYSNATPHQ